MVERTFDDFVVNKLNNLRFFEVSLFFEIINSKDIIFYLKRKQKEGHNHQAIHPKEGNSYQNIYS